MSDTTTTETPDAGETGNPFADVVDAHLAGYCEPDPALRRTLLEQAWAPDGELVDPPMEATGHEGIAALVDAVLGHFPDHRFRRTSEVDVQEMRRWGQEPLLLANIPHPETIASNAPRPTPPPAGSRSVLFVGDLEFGPNATGLEWFLRECWPLIRSGVGDAQLRIVGRGLSEHQRQEWSKSPAVTVVGFADDLRDEYARCACTIGPTWWGGGTKIKVVESAAMGRACVATPHAVRGFEYLARGPAPGIIVAGDAREFANAVVRLLDDPDRRGKMGNSAMILAAWHSNFETFRRPVAEMQERLEEELRTAR